MIGFRLILILRHSLKVLTELVVIFSDYANQASLGSFSILLYKKIGLEGRCNLLIYLYFDTQVLAWIYTQIVQHMGQVYVHHTENGLSQIVLDFVFSVKVTS